MRQLGHISEFSVQNPIFISKYILFTYMSVFMARSSRPPIFYSRSEFVDDPVSFLSIRGDLFLLSILAFCSEHVIAGVHGKKVAQKRECRAASRKASALCPRSSSETAHERNYMFDDALVRRPFSSLAFLMFASACWFVGTVSTHHLGKLVWFKYK